MFEPLSLDSTQRESKVQGSSPPSRLIGISHPRFSLGPDPPLDMRLSRSENSYRFTLGKLHSQLPGWVRLFPARGTSRCVRSVGLKARAGREISFKRVSTCLLKEEWRGFTTPRANMPTPNHSTSARWRSCRRLRGRTILTLLQRQRTSRNCCGRWTGTPRRKNWKPRSGHPRQARAGESDQVVLPIPPAPDELPAVGSLAQVCQR